MALIFHNLGPGVPLPEGAANAVYLMYNNWDDWFKHETTFSLMYCDPEGRRIPWGQTKIGRKGQTERRPEIPVTFEQLPDDYFSVGQDEDYYKAIHKSGRGVEVFKALRDMAYDRRILNRFRNEDVALNSLFRFVDINRVRNRFSRLAKGNAALSSYSFGYTFPTWEKDSEQEPLVISFEVEPDSRPPTNIHVLIGRNGVGKTTCLNNMTKSFLGESNEEDVGSFNMEDMVESSSFSNLVSVTFSAFDPFFPASPENMQRYAYVGLKKRKDGAAGATESEVAKPNRKASAYTLKAPDDLDKDFVKAALACRNPEKLKRWRAALTTLSSDPIFAETEIISLTEEDYFGFDMESDAEEIFSGLSSGHKIVLLTISKLVELVQEQSLVLIDEPEGHLHPPLLSAFIRALSELLMSQNGVAIIATHSPVVLQEVPNNCAWIINRSGRTVAANRPITETFGEDVGSLTHQVFGLEVTDTGFHKLLRSHIVDDGLTYEQALARFGGRLGNEARAVAQALALSNKNAA